VEIKTRPQNEHLASRDMTSQQIAELKPQQSAVAPASCYAISAVGVPGEWGLFMLSHHECFEE